MTGDTRGLAEMISNDAVRLLKRARSVRAALSTRLTEIEQLLNTVEDLETRLGRASAELRTVLSERGLPWDSK